MKKQLNRIIRWLFSCLIFLCERCRTESKINHVADDYTIYKTNLQAKYSDTIKRIEKLIENGDIVTRTGNDFTSESLRSLNRRDRTFSHCGIAYKEGDTLFIYHAIGGEWNPEEKIKKEPFYSFVSIQSNNCFGIYRYDSAICHSKDLFDVVKDCFDDGIKFDMEFDLKTNDKMYCAEFVAKSLEKSSRQKISINHSWIGKFEFIGIDDIILNRYCRRKYFIQYK